MIKSQRLWSVWFNGHIHTNAYGQLAIFMKRSDAREWIKQKGIPGCILKQIGIIID